MYNHYSNPAQQAKNRLLCWVLTLSMLATGSVLERQALQDWSNPAFQTIQKLEREARTAIRYSVWLYRLYKVGSHCAPGQNDTSCRASM
jgi:hypothetical protein